MKTNLTLITFDQHLDMTFFSCWKELSHSLIAVHTLQLSCGRLFPHMRGLFGEGSKIHSLPVFKKKIQWLSACSHQFYSLGQDQSTVAEWAEMTVAECALSVKYSFTCSAVQYQWNILIQFSCFNRPAVLGQLLEAHSDTYFWPVFVTPQP